MKITKAIETNEGTVQFQGELNEEELSLVIEAGLAILLRMGVLKVAGAQPEEDEENKIILN